MLLLFLDKEVHHHQWIAFQIIEILLSRFDRFFSLTLFLIKFPYTKLFLIYSKCYFESRSLNHFVFIQYLCELIAINFILVNPPINFYLINLKLIW